MELSSTKVGLCALLLFSLFVAWKVHKRSGMKIGCFGIGYVSLVVFLVGLFTIVITSVLTMRTIDNIITYWNGEKCIASIISYSSHETRDDDGNYTTMYTPTYSLKTSNGSAYEVESRYSSGGLPIVGEEVDVYFNEENKYFVELSATSLIMLCGMFIMWVVLAFAFVGIIMYAYNCDMSRYYSTIQAIGMYFFLPFVMICFEAMLIYAFFYGNEVPTFVSGILIFFILILGLSIIGILKQLISKGLPKWEKTGAGAWSADWEENDKVRNKTAQKSKRRKRDNSNYKKDY